MEKSRNKISKGFLNRSLLIFLTIILSLGLIQTNTVFGAVQTLGGRTVEGDLKITVQDTGQMDVKRYSAGTWQDQIYGSGSKGSRLQFGSNSFGFGYYTGNTTPTFLSNSKSGNTITTSWNAGSVNVTQKTTYSEGNAYFRLEWTITNNSGSSINDLRFFHGEDTYLSGGDNGAGFWDSTNNSIGVKKTISGTEQRLVLQGITIPYSYESQNYYSVYQNVNNGALTQIIDPNESTDNGYALEWRTPILSSGSSWTIVAFEKFNNAAVGGLIVSAPVSVECDAGATCEMNFTVSNQNSTSANVNLSISGTESWGQTIVGSNPRTIPGNSSAIVTVSVSVPSGTAGGTTANFTLTANDGSGNFSDTGGIYVSIPPYVAPTSFSSGSPSTGTFGFSYSHTFTANGDPSPTYSVTSGSLPPGLSLNTTTGLLSGTPNSAGGPYTFTIQASNPGGSISQQYSITIFKANSTTTITSDSPDPSVFGQNYSVSVNVSSGSGTPTGTVTVNDGTFECNISLLGGTGSCNLPSNSIGGKTLSASYLGNTNFNTSFDTESHTVIKADTTTLITSDLPDSSVYGQEYTVVVNVAAISPGNGTPSGSVTVSDGSNDCIISLTGGSGSCNLPSNLIGGKTLSASYSGDTNFNTSSDAESHSVIKANTSSSVFRSVENPVYGQPLTLSALVSPVAPAPLTPTGPIQFYIEDSPFGSQVILSNGSATSQTTTSLNAGSHTYYADFLGDANNNGSDTLPADSFTIEKNDTTISVVTATPSSVYGQPIHLTATVTEVLPSIVTPVGQVQFYINGEEIGSPVDLVNGVAQSADLHTLVLESYLLAYHIVVGEYTFSAEYLGNANSYGSSTTEEQQIVNPAVTELTITSSENPSVYGTTLDMTIKVTQQTESLTVPTGQVQLWIDGVKFMTPVTLDSNGEAVRTVPYLNLWPGLHTVTAFYTPSSPVQFIASDNTGENEPLIQEVLKATAQFTITPSVSEPVASELFTFSVHLEHPFRSEVIPTGLVQCLVDGIPLGDWVLLDVEGKAQCPESIRLSSGDHELSVAYGGDDYFFDVEKSPVLMQSVAKADTLTEFISVDPLAVVVGQPTDVSLKVSVVAPAVDTPSGKVLVSNGIDDCEITLNASGEGSCELASTSPGEKMLSASYQGSDNHNTSEAIQFEGLIVSKADSAVSITEFSPQNTVTGQPVTIRFSVIPVAPGWGQPTGLVTISDGDGRSCQAEINDLGSGECQIVFDHSGAIPLNAAYAGDDNFNPASLEGFSGLEIAKADTSLGLTTSVSPAKYGQVVTFTASISVDDPGAGQPTGYVQFSIDGSNFGEPVLLTEGLAVSEEINTLVVGSHAIGAEYLGDDNFNSSSAADITQQVDKADSVLVLTSDQNPSPYGVSVLVTAQILGVDPSERIPTSGSVQFIVDGVPYGAPVPLNSEGQANKLLPYTALWVGTHPITAIYSGNDWFNGSNNLSDPWMQVVEKGDLTILVDFSVENPVVGESFTISGEVVGNDINNPTPEGTLEFFVDDTLLGVVKTLDHTASATSDLAGGFEYGAKSVKLVYSGDDYYKAHTVETSIMVEKADTSVEITGLSSNSVVVGENVTVNFSVDVLSPGIGEATGLVTVSNGVDECSGSLTDGTGSCDLVPSFSGNMEITALYAGDANFNTSTTTQPFSGLSVEKAYLSLEITDLPTGPFVIGQLYTISVQVSPVDPGTLLPVGSIITISNGVDSCEAIIQLDGSAACEITPSTLDALDFIASFAGDDDFNAVQSTPVAGPQIDKADTQVSVSTSINPGVESTAIIFTANVSVVAPGAGNPDGFVQFQINGEDSGSMVAVQNGKATSSEIYDLPEGIHAIKAIYLGSELFNGTDSSELSQKIVAGNLSETVKPGQGTTITYHGMQNGQPVTTIVQIPADAVGEEVTVVYHQFNETGLEKPEGMDFVTHFTLKVYKNGDLQPGFEFLVPVQISMEYNPKDWDVESFEVMGWTEPDVIGWQNDGIEIIENDYETNSIVFTLQNTSPEEFSLLGVHKYVYYFPVINR